jgi:hypothetical protein
VSAELRDNHGHHYRHRNSGHYRAVEHMETVQFCGQTCHVMEPEFIAHQNLSSLGIACCNNSGRTW